MNKQSLKYILYVLLALLIIISLFNCSQNKDTVEHLGFGRRNWWWKPKAPRMPTFNFRYKPPTMPPKRCPSGQFLFSDGKTCVDNVYKTGGNAFQFPESKGFETIADQECELPQNMPAHMAPAYKLISKNRAKSGNKTCDIRCDEIMPKHQYRQRSKIPQIILDKCGPKCSGRPYDDNDYIRCGYN